MWVDKIEFLEIKKQFQLNETVMQLWAHLGSNQGPLDYESSALTS